MLKCICRVYSQPLAQMVTSRLFKHIGSAETYKILPITNLRHLSTKNCPLKSKSNRSEPLQFGDFERQVPCSRKSGSSKNVQKRLYELRQLKTVLSETFGVTEYASFFESLRNALHINNCSENEKKKLLYDIILHQHELYPEVARKIGFYLPDEVHRWFWYHIPKSESFNHYLFLLKSDVLLFTSNYCTRFTNRLMKGTEMERQLATFQIFLHDETNIKFIMEKVLKLHTFDSLIALVNGLVKAKNFRFIKVFIQALLQKLEQHCYSGKDGAKQKNLRYVKFNNTLLYYLLKSGNVELFIKTFQEELKFIVSSGLLNHIDGNEHILNFPIHHYLNLLRISNRQEELFNVISCLQSSPLMKYKLFKEFLMGELIASFQAFRDPKLVCKYLLSSYSSKASANILNALGIWGWLYHSKSTTLTAPTLARELKNKNNILPNTMRIGSPVTVPILTELYRSLLSSSSVSLESGQFKNCLLDLYYKYKSFLSEEAHKYRYWRNDTGILNVFLNYIRFQAREPRLAYNVLLDFYSQPFAKKVVLTTTLCPFSIVAYKNHTLTQAELSELLQVMHKNGVPLTFKFCSAMVMHYVKMRDEKGARSWYNKILFGGFEIRHMALIQIIKDQGWPFPKNFDETLLTELVENNNIKEPTDSTLFTDEDMFEEDGKPRFNDDDVNKCTNIVRETLKSLN
ncbi:BAD_collapsed_G0012140.mRNA.1.CDS.1 [Saccharomyces cerevisiae]|nr:CFA_G0011860.mRNA.1.CDS.1 [Saccharomyces cerevisiae]CAI4375719.1 AKH_1a_G0011990.mRNA.1.CDS.1 [Saccharomyces cerevisiae]CAI6578318.1 AKH_1a_G0011990.mRNA.1.CDS.1 [Saccharomyces cerevisiae]CAI7217840.1 CFA_G0011860.mRNA.1.CDS.1 [Saccharomyces cerevisiae]CAI7219476.1 BAD_collapsed_G0012140.mRNA.1.CDS.1 [Saccharomyces cerevisiae]